jgi:hypothetical protein
VSASIVFPPKAANERQASANGVSAAGRAGGGVAAGGISGGRAHEAAAAFEGMLLAQCLAPLAKPMGFYGDLVLGTCTQAAAESSHGGLTAILESLIERTRRGAEPLA